MTNNIDKAISLTKEQWFIELHSQIVRMMKNLMEPTVFIEIIKLLKLIDTKEKEPMLFKFINIWFKDVLYALTNKKDLISFQSQIGILELHAEKLDVKGIADAIELLEKGYIRRQANVSLNLVLQEMFIKMQKMYIWLLYKGVIYVDRTVKKDNGTKPTYEIRRFIHGSRLF